MDKREELLKPIQEAKQQVVLSSVHEILCYTDISKKKLERLQSFDNELDTDDFVALYDTSLLNSARSGILFTINGFYFEEGFAKKYFNYKDIKFMSIKQAKNGKPTDSDLLISAEGEQAKIGSTLFNKDALKELLENIISISEKWADENQAGRASGKIEKKTNLDKDQRTKCNVIIHAASAAAGGVGTGLAQIPLADNVLIAPIQVTMIVSLGGVFGIRVSESMAKGIISTLAAGFIGRGVSQILIGWVPFLGNAVNTATAAGITEAIGWTAAKHFSQLKKREDRMSMAAGIEKASRVYEEKFRYQIESFIAQKKIHENERDEFIKLLDDYEQFIIELEIDPNNYSDDNKQILTDLESKLANLKELDVTELNDPSAGKVNE
jgi:uncharacterized protein (DUF697 family)